MACSMASPSGIVSITMMRLMFAGEDPEERVLECHVEARAARVALAPGAVAQVIVDAPRLVALATQLFDARRSLLLARRSISSG